MHPGIFRAPSALSLAKTSELRNRTARHSVHVAIGSHSDAVWNRGHSIPWFFRTRLRDAGGAHPAAKASRGYQHRYVETRMDRCALFLQSYSRSMRVLPKLRLRQSPPGVRLKLKFQGYEERVGSDPIENIVPIRQVQSQIPICLFWTLSQHFVRRDGGRTGARWTDLALRMRIP